MKRTLISAACLLLLAGCGSSAKPKPVAATPSPTATTATISQYASHLNGTLKSWQEAYGHWHDDCLIDPAAICPVEALTLHISSQTLTTVIDSARDKDSHVYIGPPPAEIARLVDDTYNDAIAMSNATEDNENMDVGDVFSAGSKLSSDIDAWGPYLS